MAREYELRAKISIVSDVKDIEEAKTETDQFAETVKELDQAVKENLSTQKNFRQAISELNRENKEGTEEWRVLHRDLDRATTHMLEMRQATKGYITLAEGMEGVNRETTTTLNRLNRELDENVESQLRANEEIRENKLAAEAQEQSMRQTAIMMERVNRETEEGVLAHRANAAAMFEEAKQAAILSRQGQFLGVAMDDLRKSMVQALTIGGVAGLVFKGINLIEDALRRAAQAAIDFQKESTRTFTDLGEEVARTTAQIEELNLSQEEYYDNTVLLAREIRQGPVETQEAMRRAMNLGLDYNEAMEGIAQSTKAARVGNEELTDVVVAGMTAVNAYGEGVYTLNQVLDQYAYITQNSNLETGDLVQGMAKIISPAAEAGVSLEEVAAAMIVMNRQGDDFREIGDLLGNTLTQIAVEGSQLGEAFREASGVGFREFTAGGGTLLEGLQLLEEHAAATNQSISELTQGGSKFYRDMLAGRGVLELTGRHTRELEEAYLGTAKAVGALDRQNEEFLDTLYYQNQEMEAAREAAWAVEGSLTQGAARGWVEFKTQAYDGIRQLSSVTDAFLELDSAIEALGGDVRSQWRIRDLISSIVGEEYAGAERRLITGAITDLETIEAMTQRQNELTREAARIARSRADITEDEIARQLWAYSIGGERLDLLYTTVDAEEDLAQIRRLGIEDAKRAEEERLDALREAAQYEAMVANNRSVAEAAAARQAEWDAIIAARLEEQQTHLNSAYEQSKGLIENISELQTQIAQTDDIEALDSLNAQLQEASENLDEYYRKSIINAIAETQGYSEELVDLSVKLGIITEEAGETQKEFVRIVNAGRELAESEGFDNLNLEQQAVAAKNVADGLYDAQDAINQFDPENWNRGIERGIAQAEVGFFDPIITPRIAEGDESRLTLMEGQLEGLDQTTYEPTVDVDTGPAFTELDELDDRLALTVFDRYMTVYVDTVYGGNGGGGQDPPPNIPEFASGGDFIVPQGYNDDNYIVGVSSGERVTVTPSGMGGIAQSGAGGLKIEVVNHFSSGTHNPQEIASYTRDGLYEALEKAGLT